MTESEAKKTALKLLSIKRRKAGLLWHGLLPTARKGQYLSRIGWYVALKNGYGEEIAQIYNWFELKIFAAGYNHGCGDNRMDIYKDGI